MAWKFNPFTGTLDQVGTSLTVGSIVKSILTDMDDTGAVPVTNILFDEDGLILYNDDSSGG